VINSKNHCSMFCEGRSLVLRNNKISDKDLIILNEKERLLYFSMVENNPREPLVALVGLCPGYNQISKLVEVYNKKGDFDRARYCASFSKASSNISKMLRKIGVDKFLKVEIDNDFDYNSSELFFTTSLVKCASLKLGKGRSDEFDPLKFDFSKKCIENRFVKDILVRPSLRKIIFFGKKAEKIVKNFLINGKTIEEELKLNGKEVVFIPHPSGSNNGGVARFLRI
jgi:hypothetical protein